MVRRSVAVLALALMLNALAPGRAAACLCGGRSDDPAVPGDLAFIGVVARRDEPGLVSDIGSSWPGVRYTFAVEEVLKGHAGDFVTIRSGIGGGDCGVVMAVGERWRIFAHLFEGDYWVWICGPSQLIATGVPVPPAPLGLDSLVPLGLAAAGIAGLLALNRRRRAPEPIR
ncbi:MAG TPA: hypothetical protein VJ839_07200 [Candidatus Limnocylindria bacterium]|nr:hypothetical protein [Candidatus Limnocylindria bacterium]